MIYSAADIKAIEIGTLISQGVNGRFGAPTPVAEIFARQQDVNGRWFVCGYRKHSANGSISFSVKEGEDDRFVRIAQ